MKKTLKYFLILLGFVVILVILLLASCFVFEDKLLGKGKKIISENLGVEIEAEMMDINPFDHFPYITLSIGDLSVDGSNDSTLLQSNKVELLFNPISAFQDEVDFNSLNLANGRLDLIKQNDRWNFDFGGNRSQSSKGVKLSNIVLENINLKIRNLQDQSSANIIINNFAGSILLGDDFSLNGALSLIPKEVRTVDNFLEMKSALELVLDVKAGNEKGEAFLPVGKVDLDGEFLDLDFVLDKEQINCEGYVDAEFLEVFNLGFVFKDGTIDLDDITIRREAKEKSKIEGALRLKKVDFMFGNEEVTVSAKSLKFNEDQLISEDLRVELGDSEMDFNGILERKEKNYSVNGKLASRKIDFEDILAMMQDSTEGSATMEGKLDIDIDKIEYGKWVAKKIIGEVDLSKENLDYTVDMNTFRGKLEAEGGINYSNKVRFTSKASFEEIETEEILDQLDNLGQTMISSDNLSGELSGHALLDFYLNEDNSINEDKSNAKIALDFQKGRLTDFKMLEDFSKHIDVDDLMNVKFDHLTNLLEWKGNHLAIPWMFINNNAANFTISGHHSKENDYTYNLQVNASDVLARKFGRKKSSSRRKGWWNMYYVIEGRGEEVTTESDKNLVRNNFKRSKIQKREIFKVLLNEFGNTKILQNLNDWNLSPDQ